MMWNFVVVILVNRSALKIGAKWLKGFPWNAYPLAGIERLDMV